MKKISDDKKSSKAGGAGSGPKPIGRPVAKSLGRSGANAISRPRANINSRTSLKTTSNKSGKSNWLKYVYLFFMIAGSAVPLFLAAPHLQTYGFSPIVFLQHANSTSAAAACFADITLSAIVFLIFIWTDIKRRQASQTDFWISLLLIPIGLVTAISFYLYRRTDSKPLAR